MAFETSTRERAHLAVHYAHHVGVQAVFVRARKTGGNVLQRFGKWVSLSGRVGHVPALRHYFFQQIFRRHQAVFFALAEHGEDLIDAVGNLL